MTSKSYEKHVKVDWCEKSLPVSH